MVIIQLKKQDNRCRSLIDFKKKAQCLSKWNGRRAMRAWNGMEKGI